MPAPLIAPEKETFPNRIRWTVAECYQLADAGHLNGRYELIDGEILSKMGQNPPHRMVLMLVANWLVSLFNDLCVQRQEPIRIPGEQGRFTEPEPDVAVTLEPTTFYANQHPGTDDLLVVIEVADSSLEFDLVTKALLYARAGVREYWVADVAGRRLHIHRQPSDEGYRSLWRADIGDTVALEAHPRESIAVSSFFPPSIIESATGGSGIA
jgi:Uma2 family endonuclease